MKILSWILKAFDFIKGYIELIKTVLIIIAFVSSFAGIKSCINQKNDKDNVVNIITSELKQVKTESGKKATQAENWEFKYKALKKVTGEISQENSDLKNELIEARNTIKDYGIREKDVQNYIKNELVSKDSIRTKVIFLDGDNIEIKPIRKDHIKIDFVQDSNFLDVIYEYNASVHTIISRYPELKNNGKKHFPNWGFLFGWDYHTTSTINDPNASIVNLVEITFDK